MSDQNQDPGVSPAPSTPPSGPPPSDGWGAAGAPAGGAGVPASAAADAASAATAAFGRLGRAQQMAVAGAALLILVELVFGLVLEEYWVGDVAFILALAVLAAAFIIHVRNGKLPVSESTVIRAAGVGVAALAIVDLPYELRNGIFDNIADDLGGLGYYAGAALMAVGAWTTKEA